MLAPIGGAVGWSTGAPLLPLVEVLAIASDPHGSCGSLCVFLLVVAIVFWNSGTLGSPRIAPTVGSLLASHPR
jgi:hypothetical protein